jgi:predicted PurR-regulated permease PerM
MTDGNRMNPLLLILAIIGVIAVLGWLGMSLTHGSMMGGSMMGGWGWLIGLLVVGVVVALFVSLSRRP